MSKTKIHKLDIFQVGENVVLPAHGVGRFMELVEMSVMGENKTFFKLHFDSDNMEVLIPEEGIEESGLRKLVSKEIAEKVFEVVSRTPKNQRIVWNKRMQEYDAKIFSGVLINLAEVVRDGYVCAIDQNKSYTERSKYKMALDRVCKEISIVLKKSYSEIEAKIIDILSTKQGKFMQEDDFASFDENEFKEQIGSLESIEQKKASS